MSRNDPVRIIVSPTVPLLLALFVLLSSPLLLGALLWRHWPMNWDIALCCADYMSI